MTIPNEVFIPILGIIFFLLGWFIRFLIQKGKEHYPIEIDIVSVIIILIENFIRANPELIKKSWQVFYEKIKSWIEKNIKIDLSEEQWAMIDEYILKIYSELKNELQKEKTEEN